MGFWWLGGRALIRGSIYICGGVFTTANFEDIIHARHDVSGHNALLACHPEHTWTSACSGIGDGGVVFIA